MTTATLNDHRPILLSAGLRQAAKRAGCGRGPAALSYMGIIPFLWGRSCAGSAK